MKAIILAGGLGTRISEETHLRPKPMIEIGGRPLIWHIMKIYSFHGVNDFVICCGYKGYVIKEYFSNYFLHMSDVTFDMSLNEVSVHRKNAEPWKVTVVDTGDTSNTGGRLKRVEQHLTDSENFCFTYGDGVSDVDVKATISSHLESEKLATVTIVQPPGRYGAVNMKDGEVINFNEKPEGDGGFVSGGFFVLNKKCLSFIDDDGTSWESEVLPKLVDKRELNAYRHEGFWHSMDTLRDKNNLEALWSSPGCPWRMW